ncbi:uncharacterized protein Tco_1012299 [Tanacetum coccineum]
MSSLRELAALSNSSELKEQMLYENRLEMTKSCLISEELNRVISYLTRQINSRETLIEELRGLPASFFHDIAIILFMDNEQHRHDGYTANQLNINKQQGKKAKRNSAVGDPENIRKIRNRKYYLRNNHLEVFSDEGDSDHINGASNLNISNRVPFDSQKGRNRRHYLKNHQTYKSLNDEGCSTAMNVEVNMDASTSLVSDETLVTDKDCSESIQAEYGVLPSYDNDIDIPIADTDEVVIADTDEVVIAHIPEDVDLQYENGIGCSNETLVIDEDCDESSDAVSEIYEYDLDLEDPYDFVYDGLPSQCHVLKDPRFCVKCGAKKIEFEYPTLCCMGGKTKLVDPDIPPDLYNMFISQCDVGKRFRRSIRAYNTNFSFASMGVQLDESVSNMRSGVYTFRAHGGIYHKIDQLVLRDGKPRYLQLYFYDDDEELQHRLSWNNLDEDIVRRLTSVLAENPYVQTFRSLRELGPLDNYRVGLKKDLRLDQRLYNRPTTSEVAGIWVEGNDNISAYERSVVIYGRSEYPETIQPHHGFYDPMSYVLFFPYGETGWHSNIKRFMENEDDNVSDNSSEEDEDSKQRKKRKTVSMHEYYCYKMQIRSKVNLLLLGGRLLQQFLVDMYIKMETSRLSFLEYNQSHIRADLYQGLVDCVTSGEIQPNRIGQRVVLPASFIGGPRDKRRGFLDAMTLVQDDGKPDLFLTMTCNLKWPEIQNELLDGQTASDRRDLVARVFRAKLEVLKNLLFKKNILACVAAYVYVVEFQKRLVKHMMHGPCGQLGYDSPFIQGEPKKCRFNYPKEFIETTAQTKNSYPLYRRRDNGSTVNVRNSTLDNSIVAVKYAFKYVYKGHDKQVIHLSSDDTEPVINEIKRYQDARYISPPEAMWRIYGFSLANMNPVVFPLQVHLQNQQQVRFVDDADLTQIIERERDK